MHLFGIDYIKWLAKKILTNSRFFWDFLEFLEPLRVFFLLRLQYFGDQQQQPDCRTRLDCQALAQVSGSCGSHNLVENKLLVHY